MPLQHKLVIALVLSGLVHGLFLFGSSDHRMITDSLERSNDVIHLEFIIAAHAVHEKNASPDELNNETESVVHHKVVNNVKAFERLSKKEKLNNNRKKTEQKNKGDGRFSQEKRSTELDVEHNQLMKLIYRAISQHKRYPLMARRLRQQGKVMLNFVMHPNGQVTDVEVTESSRYSVLDRAAKNAVVAISPLAMVSDYLDDRKSFDVAVEFRLN